MKAGYLDVRGIVCKEQDWTEVLVVRVQYLSSGEAIPPGLAIAVDYT